MTDKVINLPGNLLVNPDEDNCANCAFSFFTPGQEAGQCRANPPIPLIVTNVKQGLAGRPEMEHNLQAHFPPILPITFCHTFEPRTDIIGGDDGILT